MADRGDIAVVIYKHFAINCANGAVRRRNTAAVAATGSGAIAGAVLSLSTVGRTIDHTKAEPDGTWTFHDLTPDTYYAQQSGATPAAWQIDVSSGLSVTITPLSSGGGGTVTSVG